MPRRLSGNRICTSVECMDKPVVVIRCIRVQLPALNTSQFDWVKSRLPNRAQPCEREDSARPNNWWKPVSGDHGAHGRFDARAQRMSLQVWASQHRNELAAVAGMTAFAIALMTRALGRSVC